MQTKWVEAMLTSDVGLGEVGEGVGGEIGASSTFMGAVNSDIAVGAKVAAKFCCRVELWEEEELKLCTQ